jgi:Ca2+-binding RTX toxin-like protein
MLTKFVSPYRSRIISGSPRFIRLTGAAVASLLIAVAAAHPVYATCTQDDNFYSCDNEDDTLAVSSSSTVTDSSGLNTFILSGTQTTTISVGTYDGGKSYNIFKFLNGLMGNIIIHIRPTESTMPSEPGDSDPIEDTGLLFDFSDFQQGITFNASASGPQTIYEGLEINIEHPYPPSGNTTWSTGIVGTEQNDVITGTSNDDSIQGLGGNDILNGGAGNDGVFGGEGNDIVNGGAGSDMIEGNQGSDVVNGGAGDDMINESDDGEPAKDVIDGGAGDDHITDTSGAVDPTGSGQSDVINGGSGNDTIEVLDGVNTPLDGVTINGGSGDDVIFGSENDDTINAGSGSDVISGGAGIDTINGGAGSDTQQDDCVEDNVTNVEIGCATSKQALAPVQNQVVVPAPAPAPELCVANGGTRMAVNDRGMIAVFSGFGPDAPNGFLVTEIPLAAIRNVTEEERASNAWVPLAYKESEYAPGWSVGIYWHDGHYGTQVYSDNGGTVFEDTGAVCGNF